MKRTPLKRKTPIWGTRDPDKVKVSRLLRNHPSKPEKTWMRILPDQREILNTKTPQGRMEYRERTKSMVIRQGGRCCLEEVAPMCPGRLSVDEATFEHEDGRSGPRGRDDRIELPDGTWQNGACHAVCNGWKGSKRVEYHPQATGKSITPPS